MTTPEEVLRDYLESLRNKQSLARKRALAALDQLLQERDRYRENQTVSACPRCDLKMMPAMTLEEYRKERQPEKALRARIRELEAELKEASDSVVAAGMYETLAVENARLRADLAEAKWETHKAMELVRTYQADLARLRADLAEARKALGSGHVYCLCDAYPHDPHGIFDDEDAPDCRTRAALSHQGEPTD